MVGPRPGHLQREARGLQRLPRGQPVVPKRPVQLFWRTMPARGCGANLAAARYDLCRLWLLVRRDAAGSCHSHLVLHQLLQGLQGAQPKPEPMNVSKSSELVPVGASFTNQALFFFSTIGPTVLDVFSDVNGIVQFVLTGNFMFAVASAFIFAASLYQQVKRGAIKNFYKACAESLSQGAATDELEMIFLSEKTLEAPLQFLIQIYTVMFVTSSEFAVGSFCFSLALSLYGMAGAAFDLIELDLWPVFRERDYAVLSWIRLRTEMQKKMPCIPACTISIYIYIYQLSMNSTVLEFHYNIIYIYIYIYLYIYIWTYIGLPMSRGLDISYLVLCSYSGRMPITELTDLVSHRDL